MKKGLVMALSLTLVLSFAACGNNGTTDSSASSEEVSSVASESKDDASVESTEEVSSETENTDVAGETVMSYADYVAAELESPVVIEAYVQAHQSWWDNKITVYAADEDGAYFIYNMTCSEEDSAKLVPGTKIKVTGYKTEWSGEVEIAEGATFEIEDGSYIAEATDVTDLLGTDDLINYQNQFVSFKGMTVEESEGGVAFLYNWDGSGSADSNSDLYFNVSLNGQTYTFTVESYLCDNTTDVYKTVEGLKVGDVIDMEGFLYWYNGVNPHITNVTVK